MTSGGFPEDLQRFVDEAVWTYARTMPQWPHEYIVRGRVDDQLFGRLVRHIRAHGREGPFYKRQFIYFEAEGRLYWTMGAPIEDTTVVNRCKVEDSYVARRKRSALPR